MPLSRRRYFDDKSKPELAWVGEALSPPKLDPRDRKQPQTQRIYYQSFSLGSLLVEVGDFVLIRNKDNTSLSECDVVRVDQLYQDFENKADPNRAVVTWYCRPEFLPPSVRTAGHGLEEQGAPPLDFVNEVVGEARIYDKDIVAESIYYKCTIVQGGLCELPEKVAKDKKGGKFPCYLHRLNLKETKKMGKKSYSLEPVLGKGAEVKSPIRRVLGEAKPAQQATSPKSKSSVPDPTGGPTRISRRSSGRILEEVRGSPSPTSELTSFVTNTAAKNYDSPRSVDKGLNGGYWGGQVQGKRTPITKVKEKLVETETATNSGRKVKIKFGTEMENFTGSGRKVTLKGPKKPSTLLKTPEKKYSAVVKKSSGLTPDKITSMLDSDVEMEEEKKPRKSKETAVTRKRRASVSCTTPTKLKTPVKAQRKASSRPASEVKPKVNRRRSSYARAKSEEETADTDDEDFVPQPKSRKLASKATKKKVESSSEEPSDESEDEEESESEEEEEEEEPSPKKRRKLPAKSTSSRKPAARSTRQPMKRKSFQPKMAPRPKPLGRAADSLTEAQQRLHVSAVPESLPCREEEFAEVYTYLESKLKEGGGGCYYISGVPGTGKTATVMEVMRCLQDSSDEYPDFNFYALNGMRLTCPDQAYVEMWRLLTGDKATPEHAMKLLAARFSKSAPKRATSIFLVDELDMLCNRKQSVLYNIFDWPSKPEGKLIIIAIANTMDLPERVMMGRVSSRLGLTRQTFQPYTHAQLQTIVASRLEGLEVFQQDAVQLVARKVASLSGDARRALDICRRAAEMAEAGGKERIGLGHVTAAYKEMFTSPKIQAIRSCSKYEQMVLQVLSSEFHRTGVEESSVGAVFRELSARLQIETMPVLSLPGTVAVCARLSAMRLVLAENYRHGLETKLRLNVAADDINFALKKEEED